MVIKIQYKPHEEPVNIDQQWKKIQVIENLIHEAGTGQGEIEALTAVRQEAHGAISHAATEFLKANGFNGGGTKPPKSKLQYECEKPKTTMEIAFAKAAQEKK